MATSSRKSFSKPICKRSTQALWDSALPLITATEQHPFLIGLVTGTLSLDSFRYYVLQDAIYLHEFADCLQRLSLAPGISTTDATQLNEHATNTKQAELALHESFFKTWNIVASTKGENDDGSEEPEQMPNTLLYTSYMKRVVATRSHAEGLAVMLPCYWVYRHIGNCMLKLREDLGDRYERSRWELLAFCLPPMGGSQTLFATTILSSKCLSSTSI